MTGNVYAILGGRGGVGATTTAVALGTSLAETAHRVAVIDADFENEGVGATLDPGDPDRTLRDVLRGDADLDEALVEAAHGLRVLPSGDAAPATTDVRSHALVRAAERARERFDFVFVDLGATGGAPAAVALERADGAILASTPEDDAIAAVADAATVARYHGADVLGTAFTTIPEGTEIDHEAAAEAIGTDVLALVPEDDAVPESAAAGTSLLRHDPDSAAATVYWQLARRLADGDLAGEPAGHESPTGRAADHDLTASESQPRESADAPDDATVRESHDPRADEQRRSRADDAASGERERADGAPSDDAEPVAPTAPGDVEQSHASASESSFADAREDTGEQSASNPRSQAHEGAGEQRSSKFGSRESGAADAAAAGSASDREPAGVADSATATDPEPDGEDGGEPSRNEFSWEDDPIEVDETGGDDPPFDAESALGEASDEPGTGAADEPDPEPDDGAVAGESDGEDDLDAAFKATMDKVREQREGETEDESGDEDDGDDGASGMFGIGG